MMGVGKSTVGKGLAERLGYTFIDVDKIIEKKREPQLVQFLKIKEKRILEHKSSK